MAHTVGGVFIVYLIGAIWLSVSLGLGWKETLLTGVLPFIPGDAMKVFVQRLLPKVYLRVYPHYGGKNDNSQDKMMKTHRSGRFPILYC